MVIKYQLFFDALNIAKGPSLGANFTLVCPYTLLAHYTELEWAESFGVDRRLVRVSVGLEDYEVRTYARTLMCAFVYECVHSAT
jgi:cystathionine gamma-synthase